MAQFSLFLAFVASTVAAPPEPVHKKHNCSFETLVDRIYWLPGGHGLSRGSTFLAQGGSTWGSTFLGPPTAEQAKFGSHSLSWIYHIQQLV